MKHISWVFLVVVILGMLLGCSPATKNNFAGTWMTNVGTVSFLQEGSKLIGVIEGYGGVHNESFEGAVIENKATFSTAWFGDFILSRDGDAFKSITSDLAFCGVRLNATGELPAGCGFSGKWIVPSNSGFPGGGTMVLKQAGENVTGDLHDRNGEIYDTIAGTVYWGKGWGMNGVTGKGEDISFYMNSSETGFQISMDSVDDRQLCAIRDGQPSAYLGFFTCEP